MTYTYMILFGLILNAFCANLVIWKLVIYSFLSVKKIHKVLS